MKVASSLIAGRMVGSLLENAEQKISEKEFIRRHMSLYSSQRMISLVNQLGDQLLTLPHELQQLLQETEPLNLAQDTLMSLTNLQPNQQGSYQGERVQTISDHNSTSRSTNMMKNPNGKNANEKILDKNEQNRDSNLLKLRLEDDQDDEIIEIRKQKEKLYRQQKQLENRRKQINRQIKLNKDGFNFDYNGDIIQVKSDKKKNLVSKIVAPNIPNETLDRKTIDKPIKQNGTFIKTYQIKEVDDGKSKKTKKKEVQIPKREEKYDVLFSKIKNPIEVIQVKEGVKATFNQNIIQKERRKLTNEELLQSKSNRKLSKNEYARIKTSTLRSRLEEVHNIEELEQFQPIVNVNVKEKQVEPKSFSTNLKKRAVTESEGEKIRVEDNGLKKQLIQKTRQVSSVREPQKVMDRPPSSITKKEQLSRIDQYNLNYSRNKTQYSAVKRAPDNESLLPKIQNKTQSSQPKLRQKLKEASSLRREVMKKFEQTLRV